MKIKEIVKILNAKVVTGSTRLEEEVEFGFASDLLSDVLTTNTDNLLLLTGMTNLQAIRTAEMAEIMCITFVRDKKMTQEMIDLANDNNIVTIETPFSMFHAVGVLHDNGLKPIF
jgi:precorrin-6x reductase